MILATLLHPTLPSVPPLHRWPNAAKRGLLMMAVGGVILAYILLGSGLLALLAVLTELLAM